MEQQRTAAADESKFICILQMDGMLNYLRDYLAVVVVVVASFYFSK